MSFEGDCREQYRLEGLTSDIISHSLNGQDSLCDASPLGSLLTRISISELAIMARRIHADRELRRRYIPVENLGEPGWDMLLYLFAARIENRACYKTAVTQASGTPHSTAIRYLSHLEDQGFVKTAACSLDSRVLLVSMTMKGMVHMASYLCQILTPHRRSLRTLADLVPYHTSRSHDVRGNRQRDTGVS